MKALLLLAALASPSCVSSVYQVQYYRPDLISPRSDLHLHLSLSLWKTPAASMKSGGHKTVVRSEYGVRRYYAIGILFPFIPLFGLVGDSKDRPIVLSVEHDPDVSVDLESVRAIMAKGETPVFVTSAGTEFRYASTKAGKRLDENGDPIVERVIQYLGLDASFRDSASFLLELPIVGPDETTTWSIQFDRERETEWNEWGSGPNRFPLEELLPLNPTKV